MIPWRYKQVSRGSTNVEQEPPAMMARRESVNQRNFVEMAISIVRDRPALPPYFRQGGKWMWTLRLFNTLKLLRAIVKSFKEPFRAIILKLERRFGELNYRDNSLEGEDNYFRGTLVLRAGR